jgi:hypothetical protein
MSSREAGGLETEHWLLHGFELLLRLVVLFPVEIGPVRELNSAQKPIIGPSPFPDSLVRTVSPLVARIAVPNQPHAPHLWPCQYIRHDIAQPPRLLRLLTHVSAVPPRPCEPIFQTILRVFAAGRAPETRSPRPLPTSLSPTSIQYERRES